MKKKLPDVSFFRFNGSKTKITFHDSSFPLRCYSNASIYSPLRSLSEYFLLKLLIWKMSNGTLTNTKLPEKLFAVCANITILHKYTVQVLFTSGISIGYSLHQSKNCSSRISLYLSKVYFLNSLSPNVLLNCLQNCIMYCYYWDLNPGYIFFNLYTIKLFATMFTHLEQNNKSFWNWSIMKFKLLSMWIIQLEFYWKLVTCRWF